MITSKENMKIRHRRPITQIEEARKQGRAVVIAPHRVTRRGNQGLLHLIGGSKHIKYRKLHQQENI